MKKNFRVDRYRGICRVVWGICQCNQRTTTSLHLMDIWHTSCYLWLKEHYTIKLSYLSFHLMQPMFSNHWIFLNLGCWNVIGNNFCNNESTHLVLKQHSQRKTSLINFVKHGKMEWSWKILPAALHQQVLLF